MLSNFPIQMGSYIQTAIQSVQIIATVHRQLVTPNRGEK